MQTGRKPPSSKSSRDRAWRESSTHGGDAYLQILEMEEDQSYFVLALSCKTASDQEQAVMNRITHLLEKDFATDLLIGETWYQLIGTKGKFERKLFSYSIQPYH
ncbi:hypothetical protein D478_06954 [Brevibacillus agri BAB-2500]|nr:hypothetical protein D478_06954 [Brevibacillus agri BAB-2500]